MSAASQRLQHKLWKLGLHSSQHVVAHALVQKSTVYTIYARVEIHYERWITQLVAQVRDVRVSRMVAALFCPLVP